MRRSINIYLLQLLMKHYCMYILLILRGNQEDNKVIGYIKNSRMLMFYLLKITFMNLTRTLLLVYQRENEQGCLKLLIGSKLAIPDSLNLTSTRSSFEMDSIFSLEGVCMAFIFSALCLYDSNFIEFQVHSPLSRKQRTLFLTVRLQ